jgi:hypothetical protein
LEIGDYGFERNLKGESLPTTCIPSRDELWLREESARLIPLSLS